MSIFWFRRRSKRDERLADQRPGRAVHRPAFRPTLERLEDRLAPATVSWIGPGSGNWSDAANWSRGGVPGPGDNVVINTASDATITIHSGDDLSVNALMTGSKDTLAITGGSLAVAGYSPLSG